jgi:periplasmic divalent cation tolerance protein
MVSLKRTSTTASSTGKPSKIAISKTRIACTISIVVSCRQKAQVTVIAVLTNLPDSESAFNLARELVNLRLAACVNVLAPVTSFYRWEGKDAEATEYPVLVKSTLDRYAELEAAIRKIHPYSLPEILALPIEHGLAEYLRWVEEETR